VAVHLAVELGQDQRVGEEHGVEEERLGDHQAEAEQRPPPVAAQHGA